MKFRQTTGVALLLVGFIAAALAQDITIRAVNGKTGKPLEGARLIVWTFDDMPQRMTNQGQEFELHTDGNGIATIALSKIERSHLQIWVDGEHQCIDHPNSASISVSEILLTGVTQKNSCSTKISDSATSGAVTVYARDATLLEGLAW